MDRWQLAIVRDDIARAEIADLPERAPAEGEVEVAIDLVALTANNITYAALGEKTPFLGPDAGYWDFFSDRDEPGRLPVWGFATVTRSVADGIVEGERFYGYWPLASHAVLTAGNVRDSGFSEATPRRAALPAPYNQYTRLAALGDHRDSDHDWWPIYRPLFLTGWLIADQFADEGDFGAATVIVSGASSKTALGFAQAMKARGQGPRLVALASSRSAGFTADTGLYDQVVDYGAINTIAAEGKVAMVDFAGNPAATRAVHERFGDNLAVDMKVGITHWDAERGGAPLPGPRPIGFFAPGRMQKRSADWGAQGLRERSEAAWLDFMPTARRLTAIDRRVGAEAALAAYRDAVAGRVDPRAGLLIEP
ncbi:MAG: DUF2855 family protein [Sphingomonas sp.]|uniref:DUF2855 family protein n=1 Tax=Sphingomonas sp. TaxID=28214 RepID=UPI003F8039F6